MEYYYLDLDDIDRLVDILITKTDYSKIISNSAEPDIISYYHLLITNKYPKYISENESTTLKYARWLNIQIKASTTSKEIRSETSDIFSMMKARHISLEIN